MKIRVISIIFLASMLMGLIIVTGCTFLDQKSQAPSIKVDEQEDYGPAGLDDAISALLSEDYGRLKREGNYSVYYIYGKDLDSSGKANIWIFAIKTKSDQYYFEYSNGTMKKYAWNERISDKPILLDQILMPSQVFSLHRSTVDPIFSKKDDEIEIHLRNGVYSVLKMTANPQEYAFNAYSGNVIG